MPSSSLATYKVVSSRHLVLIPLSTNERLSFCPTLSIFLHVSPPLLPIYIILPTDEVVLP